MPNLNEVPDFAQNPF